MKYIVLRVFGITANLNIVATLSDYPSYFESKAAIVSRFYCLKYIDFLIKYVKFYLLLYSLQFTILIPWTPVIARVRDRNKLPK